VGFRLNRKSEDAPVQLWHEGKVILARLLGSRPQNVAITAMNGDVLVCDSGQSFLFSLHQASGDAAAVESDGAIRSPMPGTVVAVEVGEGDAVVKGQRLVVLSAMKMELAMEAPFDGIVAELHAAAGINVSDGVLLLRIEKS